MRIRPAYTAPLFSARPSTVLADARRGDLRASVAMTMDFILASCPTDAEIKSIRTDFPFTFDSKLPMPSIECTPGGSEYGAYLSLINAFRCMKALTFNKPIPVVGATNLYKWMKDNKIAIRVVDGDEASWADLKSHTIFILRAVLDGYSDGGWNRQWEADTGYGMKAVIGLLFHETAHVALPEKIHDCSVVFDPEKSTYSHDVYQCYRWIQSSTVGERWILLAQDGSVVFKILTSGKTVDIYGREMPEDDPVRTKVSKLIWNNDSSLEYGGVWAAQYWWNMWLAEHSGSYLTDDQKKLAKRDGDRLLTNRMSCCKLSPGGVESIFLAMKALPTKLSASDAAYAEIPKAAPDVRAMALIAKPSGQAAIQPTTLRAQIPVPTEQPFFMRVTGGAVGETAPEPEPNILARTRQPESAAPIVLGAIGSGLLFLAEVSVGWAVLPLVGGIAWWLKKRP